MTPNLRDIVVWPNDILTCPCNVVIDFDDDLQQLVADMIHTMQHWLGIGLAAPQIGVSSNVIVIVNDHGPDVVPLSLINPQLIEVAEDKFQWDEGCLSVPGYYEARKRPNRVVVQYQDVSGNEHQSEFVGLWAFVIQHEMDHLNGKVFVDTLTPLKKKRVKNKVRKTLKDQRR